jgi:hypothetical protein
MTICAVRAAPSSDPAVYPNVIRNSCRDAVELSNMTASGTRVHFPNPAAHTDEVSDWKCW